MPVFCEDFLRGVSALPGASYSFLRQVALPESARVRSALTATIKDAGAEVSDRWEDLLSSLDNRRFFQGYAEVATAARLRAAGWRFPRLGARPTTLIATHPTEGERDLLVLSFIRQVRPAPDQEVIGRMVRALNRVGSRARISIHVRRWLDHDFDPEPVRRAIDLWLREVDRGGWDGRYAAYEDERISLEFALTGEEAVPGAGVVAFAVGPFVGQRSREVLERQLIFELDHHRLGGEGDRTLVAAVADQPWPLPPGHVRELLYGKPTRISTTGEAGSTEFTFGAEYMPSVFRDPHFEGLGALMLLNRGSASGIALEGKSYLNPWAADRPHSESLPGRVLSPVRREGGASVLRWLEPGA